MKIPPGMPADQAQGILTLLKTNPDAAKAAWAQAQAILQNPGLANAFVNMQVGKGAAGTATPGWWGLAVTALRRRGTRSKGGLLGGQRESKGKVAGWLGGWRVWGVPPV